MPTPTLTIPATNNPLLLRAKLERPWKANNNEIYGYGYAPTRIGSQTRDSDLIAWVKHLSAEPSFRINPNETPNRRYEAFTKLTFGVLETLWGTPSGEEIVVEYEQGLWGSEEQALDRSKEWLGWPHTDWWFNKEAIVFLWDIRLGRYGKVNLDIDKHYRLVTTLPCPNHASCWGWSIYDNDEWGNWVWLPAVGHDKTRDNEPIFRVATIPYEAQHDDTVLGYASLSNIKAILDTHLTYGDARREYFSRITDLWDAAGSDNYTVVISQTGIEDSPLSIPRKVVVRNGEPVEAFYTQDTVVEGVTFRAGEKAEHLDLSLDFPLWSIAKMHWARGAKGIHATFDYEYGYPTAVHWHYGTENHVTFTADDYTPLKE